MSLERETKRKSFNNVRGIMGMTMGVIYIVIAAAIVYLQKAGQIHIGVVYSYIVGGLMAAYGIFRIFRGYKIMKGDY